MLILIDKCTVDFFVYLTHINGQYESINLLFNILYLAFLSNNPSLIFNQNLK